MWAQIDTWVKEGKRPHGSHSSSSGDFMRDLEPTVVVVSNGSVDKYKHPKAVTLKTYASSS
jgi:beta-lactamase superfamily II metal-dependent hydrolase